MKNLALILVLSISVSVHSQVGIGTSAPHSSAALEVKSESRGVLFPSMTSAQRIAISSPAAGLLVFQTNSPSGYYYYTGTDWTMLASQENSSVPAGTIMAFAGNTPPAGWAFCDGSAISRSSYSGLFTAISTTYGTGNGSTTFNLPDLRGRTIFGKDNMGGTSANLLTSAGGGINGTTLGASGGNQSRTLDVNNIPSHNHAFDVTSSSNGSHSHTYTDAYFAEHGGGGVGGNSVFGLSAGSDHDNSFRFRTSGNGWSNQPSSINTSSEAAHAHSVKGNTNNTGSGTAFSMVNPGLVLNYIIKL